MQPSAQWAAWRADQQLVSVYAGLIGAALGGAFIIASLAVAWKTLGAGLKYAQAQTWLLQEGIDNSLRNALRGVLARLWRDAWGEGVKAAEAASGRSGSPGFNVDDFTERYGRQWLNQIVQTRLEGIAAILAQNLDLTALIAALREYMRSEDAANLIAVTEVTRAINISAAEHYRYAGIYQVRWVTEGPDPCPACIANREAGPRQIGMPFPSGATAPPQHPRCRCALLPA